MLRSGVLPEKLINEFVTFYKNEWVRRFDMERDSNVDTDNPIEQSSLLKRNKLFNAIFAKEEDYNNYIEVFKKRLATDKINLGRRIGYKDKDIIGIVDAALNGLGVDLNNDSVEYMSFCNKLLEARVNAQSIIIEHLSGNFNTEYDTDIKNKKAYLKLSELIALYEKDKSDSWANPTRFMSCHRQILHILGDISLNNIDTNTSINLREALKEYPSRLKQSDMNKPWQELSKTRNERLAPRTQHFIKCQFATLMNYAMNKNLGVVGNPAKGIAGKKPSSKKAHVPYSKDELQNLVFTLMKLNRSRFPEMFWIPLLLLYTGARSNEICMLRCDDIEQMKDIWVFNFFNRSEYQQKTKNGEDRRTPVHNQLIELGFLDYLNRQKLSGCDKLFSNLKLENGKWNVSFGKKFNGTFKKKFLKGYTDEQLHEKTLHSFRKCMTRWFIQQKSLVNLPNIKILQSIIGHYDEKEISFLIQFVKDADITIETYGGGYGEIREQNELLQKLDYGIDLTILK